MTAFFVGLGLEVEGRTFVEGQFVDTVIGIPGSRSHIVMLRPPEGGAGLELSSFAQPDHEPGSPTGVEDPVLCCDPGQFHERSGGAQPEGVEVLDRREGAATSRSWRMRGSVRHACSPRLASRPPCGILSRWRRPSVVLE